MLRRVYLDYDKILLLHNVDHGNEFNNLIDFTGKYINESHWAEFLFDNGSPRMFLAMPRKPVEVGETVKLTIPCSGDTPNFVILSQCVGYFAWLTIFERIVV